MPQKRWLRFLHHPFTVAGVAMVLAVTGLVEVAALFLDSDPTNDWDVQAAHGQALFGILLFIRALGDGIEHVQKVKGGLHDAKEALRRKREGARSE